MFFEKCGVKVALGMVSDLINWLRLSELTFKLSAGSVWRPPQST